MVHAPSAEVRLDLGAESVLSGVVVDGETGTPLSGIRVQALLPPTSDRYANRQGVTVSDAEGKWEIRGLQPAHYVLDAEGEASWGRAREGIDLGVAEYRDAIRIEMIPGTEIEGRIVDAETGEPCTEGEALASDRGQGRDRGSKSDTDGRVTVPGLTGGSAYSVTVACRGYLTSRFEVDLRDGPVPSQTWPLTRGSELEVRVVDRSGDPLAAWTVTLVSPPRPEAPREPPHVVTTDADGRAAFSGLATGKHAVWASGAGPAFVPTTEVEVGSEPTSVELTAPAGGSVTGSVTNADGDPVPGALVILRPVEADPRERPHLAVTEIGGSFRHAGVGFGDHGVWVVPRDEAGAHLRPDFLGAWSMPGDAVRTVLVDDDELVLNLQLSRLRSIAGTVRDEDGDLVEGARVFATRQVPGRHVGGNRGAPRLTDAEGRYRFDELAEGNYSVVAYRPGGGIVSRWGVEAGAEAADLVFARTGTIEGRVIAADGASVPAFQIWAGGEGLPRRPPGLVGSRDGRFVLSALVAGRYHLLIRSSVGTGEATVELTPGEKRVGLEITLEPYTRLEGRIVDARGSALLGWNVVATDPSPTPSFSLTVPTNADGSFRFDEVLAERRTAIKAVPSLPGTLPPQELINRAPVLRMLEPARGELTDLGDLVVDTNEQE